MTPVAPHITAFLRERLPVERRASEHTCDAYAHAFRLLFEYAAGQLRTKPSQLQLEQIDAALVLRFLAHIETERGNRPITRNARLAAIKSFMHYVEYKVPSALEQARQILAIPSKKTETRLVSHLTLEEVKAILDSPDPRTRLGTRDRAMLQVCFNAGLRASELVGLRVDAVSLVPRPSIRVLGKGRRERQLPLWKETGAALRAWLAIRGRKGTGSVSERRRRSDDPRRIRMCAQAARRRREVAVSFTEGQARLSAYSAPHLRAGDAQSNEGYPEGGALAGAQLRTDHRNVRSGRSNREAGGSKCHHATALAQRQVPGTRSAD